MQNTSMQNTVQRIVHKILDVAGAILDSLERRAAEQAAIDEASSKPTLTAIEAAPWRWANDQFGFWRSCAKPACRRARGCRGEPRACLDRHLPQVPQKARDRVRALLRPAFSQRFPSHQPSASSTTPTAPEASPCLRRMRIRPVS
jgi:hypothetical protein